MQGLMEIQQDVVLAGAEVAGQVGVEVEVGADVAIMHAQQDVNILSAVEPTDEYDLEHLGSISAKFQQGLYYIHNSWRDPIREICTRLWDVTAGENPRDALINYSASTILPGLISCIRKLISGIKPIDFLVGVANSADPAMTRQTR